MSHPANSPICNPHTQISHSSSSNTSATWNPSIIPNASANQFFSAREGTDWCDGHPVLEETYKTKHSFLRPWDCCIAFCDLSKDNLPPFYVRLRDDQVGHLRRWQSKNSSQLRSPCLSRFWPADFTSIGQISFTRENWGTPFNAEKPEDREKLLKGGSSPPVYTDPGLPLTWTSSLKIMRRETQSSKQPSNLPEVVKTNKSHDVTPRKRPRLSSEVPLPATESTQLDGSRDKAVQVLVHAIDESEAKTKELDTILKKKEKEVDKLRSELERQKTATNDCKDLKEDRDRMRAAFTSREKELSQKIKDQEAEINRLSSENIDRKFDSFIAEGMVQRHADRLAKMQTSCAEAQESCEKVKLQLGKWREDRKG